MPRDTPSASARLVAEYEGVLLEHLSATEERSVRLGTTTGQFSWLEVVVREAVLAGAEYQSQALPPRLRGVALDLREPRVEYWVRSQIQRLLEPYTADAEVVLRSNLVASGAANAAIFFGRHELINQAIERGLIRASDVQREWRAVRDRRTRDSHFQLHGQVRPWGIPFVSPHTGVSLMHPHDAAAPIYEVANCRCSEIIRLLA